MRENDLMKSIISNFCILSTKTQEVLTCWVLDATNLLPEVLEEDIQTKMISNPAITNVLSSIRQSVKAESVETIDYSEAHRLLSNATAAHITKNSIYFA